MKCLAHKIITYYWQNYYEYATVLYNKVQVNGTRFYEVVGIINVS
ncbi:MULTISPECIES: hypothetical protein [unclassified Polaribacter]|nr:MULTISPECIES: hypothetical protein [unclassified Polaribacter]